MSSSPYLVQASNEVEPEPRVTVCSHIDTINVLKDPSTGTRCSKSLIMGTKYQYRHGETVDNVAGVYAGITDSALTNHGVLQANRLGTHLACWKISNIFSSDLQRAVKTAEAIRAAQDNGTALEIAKLDLLREQDFGYYEKKTFHERSKDQIKSGKETYFKAHRNRPEFKDVESKESMKGRMETFVKEHLMHFLDNNDNSPNDHAIVIVAHGIILGYLWRVILRQFSPKNISIGPDVPNLERGLEYLGVWSNTGYLDSDIMSIQHLSPAKVGSVSPVLDEQQSDDQITMGLSSGENEHSEVPLDDQANIQNSLKLSQHRLGNFVVVMSLVVKSVNNQDHLRGLKKTRGGLGSLKHDSTQKTMDSFFKKRKLG
ncbi:hypothetical protein SBOR_3865 [Sclerotinia borealis F-4128]|uniref:Phosphoglycerate mutase family protein n=1 Tax=Sclerotinia borealis (strain F-4128) TaxID=1432307 RepID=W9CIE4_SCLBF|nr:hypothetical protein SBOR_3865 [Sclerotinia borealis F-4128]